MSQLTELTAFIKANTPERVMTEFSSDMEQPQLIRSTKNLNNGQMRIGILRYEAALSWERFPYREFDPQNIFALILMFLNQFANEFDDVLEFDSPTIDLDIIDDEIAILVISINLADEICLVADENGNIPGINERYRVASPEIWVAESASIYGADSQGAPANEG